MPREGIDYPGWWNRAACSIRCELSKLWSAVGSKVAKLNTVEPDGDGKVSIVSDSATLSVTDDPSNNAVRLELDAGLSSPPVQSVNGQTGAVVLGGSDINSPTTLSYDGTSTSYINASVRTLLIRAANGAKAGDDALRTRMTAAETAISGEQSARAAADNALQLQLNNDVVLLDPAGAQTIDEDLTLNDDLNVGGDLAVTGTSAFGGTTTAPTPGQNGGSTEVTTIGYVSNTGGLNNLLHTNGDESASGKKYFEHGLQDALTVLPGALGSPGRWYEIFNYPSGSSYQIINFHVDYIVTAMAVRGRVLADTNSIILTNINESGTKTSAAIYDDGSKVHVYIKIPQATYAKVSLEAFTYGTYITPIYTKAASAASVTLPASATQTTY